MLEMNEWKVIGISGATCAGKTTLAQKLVQKFDKSVVLSQDHFYRCDNDPNHEWVLLSHGIQFQNWESMASVDWEAFTQAIRQTLATAPPNPSALAIIEGHLIFNNKFISDVCHKKVFLTLQRNQCFERRNSRIISPKDPKGYFEAYVWPIYLKNFNDLTTLSTDIPIEFIAGSVDRNVIFDKIVEYLQ